MKKVFLAILIVIAFVSSSMAGTDYVLMVLQPETVTINGEQVQGWHLINGTQTYDVLLNHGHILATSGAWSMVMFQLEVIKPQTWSNLQAADWLANADGFLAFDYRMLYEGARLSASIKNRTFDYSDVLNAVIRLEWWIESDGEWTRYTGNRSDWQNTGYPKTARVLPQPLVYLGSYN